MNEIDKVQLLAELNHEFCELNHGPDTRREDYPATDYIIMPFGYAENEITEVTAREVVVPICAECAQALLGEEWTLLYCFDCCSSQWVHRALSKNQYRHHILWLRGCPDCGGKFGGLYFNDIKAVVDYPNFLSHMVAELAA